MKALILSFAMFLSVVSSAAAACEGEAQIIGTVAAASFTPASTCLVSIKNFRHFASNPFCPLTVADIAYSHVKMFAKTEKSCLALIGEEVSGVVVKRGDSLELE